MDDRARRCRCWRGRPNLVSPDGAGSASETLVKYLALTTLVLVALALVLALVLPIDEENFMLSSSPAKPAPFNNTPADELPFPGKLVEGKYDVQYLHL